MAWSQYIADALINWMRGTAFPAVPANLYAALHTASPGMTGANESTDATYARVAIPTAGAQWDAPSTSGASRVTQNVNVVLWPVLTVGGTYTHVSLWDALSGGNMIKAGAFSPALVVGAGEQPRITAGNLDDALVTL